MWSRRERDRFVRALKRDVKPGEEGMNVCEVFVIPPVLNVTMRRTVIAGRTELKGGYKCQVLFLCGCQIYALKKSRSVARLGQNLVTNLKNAWIRYDCLHLDGVNQWFT